MREWSAQGASVPRNSPRTDPEKAKTRDKIWTPEKQRKGEGSAQLWTPTERNIESPVEKPADAGKQS